MNTQEARTQEFTPGHTLTHDLAIAIQCWECKQLYKCVSNEHKGCHFCSETCKKHFMETK